MGLLGRTRRVTRSRVTRSFYPRSHQKMCLQTFRVPSECGAKDPTAGAQKSKNRPSPSNLEGLGNRLAEVLPLASALACGPRAWGRGRG